MRAKANCEQGGWSGVDAVPLQTNSSGLRICESELGYDFAFSFEDGSTIHSNMDVEVLQNGKIILKSGQKSRFIHSWDPRVEKLPAPNISLPDLNSVKVKVHSAKSLDGTNGQTIFTHDGTSEYFNAGTDWQDFGIINNGEIENASDIEIEVGNENPLPVVESQPEPQPEQNPEPAIVEALQNVDAGSSEPDTAVETVSVAEPASPPVDSAVLAEQPAQIEPQPESSAVELPIEAVAEMYTAAEEVPDAGSNVEADASGAEETFILPVDILPQQPETNPESTSELVSESQPDAQNADGEETAQPSDETQTPESATDIGVDGGGADIPQDTDADVLLTQLDILKEAEEADVSQKLDITSIDGVSVFDIPAGADAIQPQSDTSQKSQEGNGAGSCSCEINSGAETTSSLSFATLVLAAVAASRRKIRALVRS